LSGEQFAINFIYNNSKQQKEKIIQMKQIQSRFKILGTLFFLSTTVFAQSENSNNSGLFIEPSAVIESGKTSVNFPSPFSDSTGKIEGLGVAAKVGLHFKEILFAGLDTQYSVPKFKDSSTSYDSKATSYAYGPMIGIQMPVIGLRLWGSYILGGEIDPEESGGIDVKFTKETGYKLGAGFHIASIPLLRSGGTL
jgi:hypothetical protein